MTQKIYLKAVLIISLVCVSLGGFLLHIRIHTLDSDPSNFVPFIAGIISILAVSSMFMVKNLIPYAYLTNGMLAIIGTITMAHFSVEHWPPQATFSTLFLETLLADIFIVWCAFFIGKALFELNMTHETNLEKSRPKGRFIRYPNMGYWGIHLIGLGLIYSLGHILWK